MRAKVIIAAVLAVMVAVSCRGGQVGAPGTASLPAPQRPLEAAKQPLTQQDRLFNAYVAAAHRYGLWHGFVEQGLGEPIDDEKTENDLRNCLVAGLENYKTMPEYYEVISPGIGADRATEIDYLKEAAKLAPNNWNVACLAAGLPAGFSQTYTKDDFAKAMVLCRRFPDEAFLHYVAALSAVDAGDLTTAWRQVRLGNEAPNLRSPELFPVRYLYERYMANKPPKIPFDAGRWIGLTTYDFLYAGGTRHAMKRLLENWGNSRSTTDKPTPTELHKMICRLGMMEPVGLITIFSTETSLADLNRRARARNTSAWEQALIDSSSPRSADAAAGVRRYLLLRGRLNGLAGGVLSADDFLYEKSRRLSAKDEGSEARVNAASGRWGSRFGEDEERYAWEVLDGDYYQWTYCEHVIKPVLERLVKFDFSNPATFEPPRTPRAAAKDKTAK